MKDFRQLKTKLLKDRDIKRAYEKLGPEFEFIQMLIQKRIDRGLTQKELAEKIGTKQAAISRLESGDYNPTVSVLRKVVDALGAKMEILIK